LFRSWIQSGNPKNGEVVHEGTFPIPDKGEIHEIHYQPTKSGLYKFKAYHETGHGNGNSEGKGPWSGTIEVTCEGNEGEVEEEENILPEITNLVATPDSNTITLSWKNPSDIESITIYRDGTKIASDLESETFEDINLEPNTTYSYKITTITSGNESTGVGMDVTTTEVADTDSPPIDPPIEEEITVAEVINPTWERANNGNTKINLSWLNPDIPEFDHVIVFENDKKVYEGNGGNPNSPFTLKNNIEVPTRNTEYVYKIVVVDANGNESEGVTINVTIPEK